jgi:hypothetical protein
MKKFGLFFCRLFWEPEWLCSPLKRLPLMLPKPFPVHRETGCMISQ